MGSEATATDSAGTSARLQQAGSSDDYEEEFEASLNVPSHIASPVAAIPTKVPDGLDNAISDSNAPAKQEAPQAPGAHPVTPSEASMHGDDYDAFEASTSAASPTMEESRKK